MPLCPYRCRSCRNEVDGRCCSCGFHYCRGCIAASSQSRVPHVEEKLCRDCHERSFSVGRGDSPRGLLSARCISSEKRLRDEDLSSQLNDQTCEHGTLHLNTVSRCLSLSQMHVDVFFTWEPSPTPVILRGPQLETDGEVDGITEPPWIRSIESAYVVSSLRDSPRRREVVIIGGLHVLASAVCLALLGVFVWHSSLRTE